MAKIFKKPDNVIVAFITSITVMCIVFLIFAGKYFQAEELLRENLKLKQKVLNLEHEIQRLELDRPKEKREFRYQSDENTSVDFIRKIEGNR